MLNSSQERIITTAKNYELERRIQYLEERCDEYVRRLEAVQQKVDRLQRSLRSQN